MPGDGRPVGLGGQDSAYKPRHDGYTQAYARPYIRRRSTHRKPNARRDSARFGAITAFRM